MPTPLLNEDEELIEAVKAGRESKVRALLVCGGPVRMAVDKEGKTALHWACQYGHLHILCLLLSRLPSPSSSLPDSQSSDREERGVCSLCSGVIKSERRVRNLQESPDSFVQCREDVLNRNFKDSEGNGVEDGGSRSIGHGRGVVVPRTDSRELCTCNTNRVTSSHVINTRDVKGQTPLHLACNYRRADVASFLVTLPFCDVNCRDRAGNSPLHRAIHNELDNLACLLCDAGADVRAANSQLLTPLHEAIRGANENVVRTLLARGCDVNAVTKSMAAPTPFLTAVFYYKISTRSSDYLSFLDTTLQLLIESGCKLSQGDYQWTPLAAAIDIDNSFIAALLLFHGCRFQKNYCRRSYGRSLLVEAFTHCEGHVVKLLVLCGYQPSLEEADQCSRRIPSFSPLFYRISRSERAAMRSKTELLAWLRQRACGVRSLMEISRACVRQGMNAGAQDTSILKRIPDLPLPKVLRQYVGLSDFPENGLM
ncbi:hypothetical protein ACOMHN_002238 [Nucella lapillus]